MKSKSRKIKKPSKTLMNKINQYNKLNEASNKKLATKRNDVIRQAKKEGFAINVR